MDPLRALSDVTHSGEKERRRRALVVGRPREGCVQHPREETSRHRDHAVIGLSMRPDGGQRTVLFSAGKPLVAVTSCRRNEFRDSRSGPWLRLKLARMSLDHRISVLNGSVTPSRSITRDN